VVVDKYVLDRLIGTPKTTYDQLVQVADMSMRSYICVQVVPASTGAYAGLGGAFMIASLDGKPDVSYIDAFGDQTNPSI
jgi:hypothetical protein